jgi:hypothetical protein
MRSTFAHRTGTLERIRIPDGYGATWVHRTAETTLIETTRTILAAQTWRKANPAAATWAKTGTAAQTWAKASPDDQMWSAT